MDIEKKWYWIKHECGSVFALNVKSFNDSFQDAKREMIIKCPNCGKTALQNEDTEHIMHIFDNIKLLSSNGLCIEQVIDSKDLQEEKLLYPGF